MASNGVRNRGDLASQPKVRFSSIQYHDPSPAVDKENEITFPTKSAAKQRYLKYTQTTDNAPPEGLRSLVPDLDTKLNVDHQHYEQWARVPNKRVNNSILLRGIQQLKARAKREYLEEDCRPFMSSQSRNLLSREANEVNPKDITIREIYQRDGFSRLGSTKDLRPCHKDSSNREIIHRDMPVKDVVPKGVTPKEICIRETSTKDRDKAEAKVTRVLLRFKTVQNVDNNTDVRQNGPLPNSVLDTVLNKPYIAFRQNQNDNTTDMHACGQESYENKHEHEMQTKSDNQIARDLIKSRYGVHKLRERSPFPVSIKQQKYYGEPVFVVSDPYKHRDLPKSKTRIDMFHDLSNNASPGLNGVRPKIEVTEIRLPGDTAEIQDEFYRSKSFVASFPSRKQPSSRMPAQVPSADFCDISQLEEVKPRHSAYASLLERSRTESAFSCKTPHLLKWVPRVQRMKELLK